MTEYKYSQTWFLNSEIKNFLIHFLDESKPNNILEIGCFEGLSSVFFADNFINHKDSSLTCVDPFLTIDSNDHKLFLQNNEEKNFDFNVSICQNFDKIIIYKTTSDNFFKFNNKIYNFIYIDGCHEPNFIQRDMENSFNVLDINGIMWMDDYGGGDGIQIKNTMNEFLHKYKGLYELIHTGYQLAIKKIKNINNKIIDCFIFYNELDLLTYRLNILNSVADYFIIVESTHTFVGKEKQLFFNDNKHLFEAFNEKIIHIIVDDFPSKELCNGDKVWQNEYFQRNAISRGLNELDTVLELNDMIIISDIDEIPNPHTIYDLKNKQLVNNINILQMDLYYYNLNTKFTTPWNLCKIMSYQKYKELGMICSTIRSIDCPIILNGGWHLSYFGDPNFIKNKIENFSHQELNTSKFTNLENIEEKIKNFTDLYERENDIKKIDIENNNNLPPKYDVYLVKYYT